MRNPVDWFTHQRHPGNAIGIIRDRCKCRRLLRPRIGRLSPFQDDGGKTIQPDFVLGAKNRAFNRAPA